MRIHNHKLINDDDSECDFNESPNQSGGLKAEYLVMHYSATGSASSCINWLVDSRAQASAHLVIGRDGKITQLVPFNRVAWHAGRSQWAGHSSMNRYSIGIELENAGALQRKDSTWVSWLDREYSSENVVEAIHKNDNELKGWHRYTEAQIYAALEVAAVLVAHYDLKDVVGHDDIAPGRKQDPGPAFPMDAFRSRIFGRNDDETTSIPAITTADLNIYQGPGTDYSELDDSPLMKGSDILVDEQQCWRQVLVLDDSHGGECIEGWIFGNDYKVLDE